MDPTAAAAPGALRGLFGRAQQARCPVEFVYHLIAHIISRPSPMDQGPIMGPQPHGHDPH